MFSSKFEETCKKIERLLGGLKLAIVLISLFVLCLVVGTFMESFHGTEYANRLIYKSLPFMVLQFFLFLSILMATLLRLPPKKRLYGFYTIHAGLILVLCGSYITYDAGIDGTITLAPNSPSRIVTLSKDTFTITLPEDKKKLTYSLPNGPFPTEIGNAWEEIRMQTFLPFSENELHWVSFPNPSGKNYHSSQYILANAMVTQDLTVSLHPESIAFPASLTLGPLNIHYLPEEIFPCFKKNPPSQVILWDTEKRICFTPEEQGLSMKSTSKGNRFLVLNYQMAGESAPQLITFFPDMGPWPLTKNFQFVENSSLRIFGLGLFQQKPHLFLFGKGAAYFQNKQWVTQSLEKNQKLTLPWMNFELQLTNHHLDKRPEWVPRYIKPVHENGQIVSGDQKALKVQVQDQNYWVQSGSPLQLLVDGKKVIMELKKETLQLPYEFNLDSFKMDVDPGTNNPASYESFVTLFNRDGHQKHHVFMNNPLKYEQYTFYQASYFPTDDGGYGSVLSVNFDPGRPIKYLGSLLLVLGAIAHYQLNKVRYQKKKKKQSGENQQKQNPDDGSPNYLMEEKSLVSSPAVEA